MTTEWTINEIAKLTNLSKDTIRYYEKEKLITPKRSDNNYRIYSKEELLKLKYIAVMKYARFSLKEINTFVLLFDQELSEDCNQQGKTLLEKKISDLERAVRHYQAILQLLKQIPYTDDFQQLKQHLENSGTDHSLDSFIEKLFEEIKEETYENNLSFH
ncbi:MerR family transcriptional regulator [Enterococcus sp. LJL128]